MTALPLCSQLPVSPGNTHVPGTAQTQERAKPFLQGKWGTGHPFQGLCLWQSWRWAPRHESPLPRALVLCAIRHPQPSQQDHGGSRHSGRQAIWWNLESGTLTGVEVAVLYPWCCALAKVGRVSKRAKVIKTEGPQSGAHMLKADPNKGPSLPLTPGPFKWEGTQTWSVLQTALRDVSWSPTLGDRETEAGHMGRLPNRTCLGSEDSCAWGCSTCYTLR